MQGVPPDSWVSYVLATWVAVGLIASLVLFLLAVVGNRRAMNGQAQGLTYTLLTLPIFLFTFIDRLPALGQFVSTVRLTRSFTSSFLALVVLAFLYAVRTGVYLQLFAIPAIRLDEEQYYSRDRVEARANDFTAPLFAFTSFAVALAAAIAGVLHLPLFIGVLIFLAVFAVYTFAAYLTDLQVPLIWLTVQLTIGVRQLLRRVSAGLTLLVIQVARFEKWRRRDSRDIEAFIVRMETKIETSRREAQEADARDRARLQDAMNRLESKQQERA